MSTRGQDNQIQIGRKQGELDNALRDRLYPARKAWARAEHFAYFGRYDRSAIWVAWAARLTERALA